MKPSIDQRSKDLFTALLTKAGFTNITNTDASHSTNYYLDLEAEKDGKKYGFELKDRNCSHTFFGDIMCEKSKYYKAYRDLTNGTYDVVYVCNIYADNTLALNFIQNGSEVDLYCPNTTHFSNRDYSYKKMWSMPQQILFSFDDTNTFTRVK